MKFITTLLATQLPTVFLCAGLVHATAAPTKPNIRWVAVQPLVEELYDLKTDSLEGHNLAASPEHAKTLARLRDRWAKYLEELK
jgi:hypothetical protein